MFGDKTKSYRGMRPLNVFLIPMYKIMTKIKNGSVTIFFANTPNIYRPNSAGAVEYTDCISADGYDSPN